MMIAMRRMQKNIHLYTYKGFFEIGLPTFITVKIKITFDLKSYTKKKRFAGRQSGIFTI